MSEGFGVTEFAGADGDDGVAGVFGEGVAVVVAVRNLLDLLLAGTGAQSVEGYDAVCLVGKEARGVVGVEHSGTAEDLLARPVREEGNLLVRPGVEIL